MRPRGWRSEEKGERPKQALHGREIRTLGKGRTFTTGDVVTCVARTEGLALPSRCMMSGMEPPTEIRPFAEEDTEAVVALWEACELVRPWNDPRKDIQRKVRVGRQMFLVALDGPELIGTVMAGYEGHRGWINYLAVRADRRRNGLGTRLMAEAERLLIEAGCPKINLQIREENSDVIAFYRAIGYEPDRVVSLGKRLVED